MWEWDMLRGVVRFGIAHNPPGGKCTSAGEVSQHVSAASRVCVRACACALLLLCPIVISPHTGLLLPGGCWCVRRARLCCCCLVVTGVRLCLFASSGAAAAAAVVLLLPPLSLHSGPLIFFTLPM